VSRVLDAVLSLTAGSIPGVVKANERRGIGLQVAQLGERVANDVLAVRNLRIEVLIA